MKNFGKLAVLGAALAVSATYSFATTIPVTATDTLGAFVTSISGTINGTVNGPPNFSASFTESVYDWSGGLAFEYTITNSAPTVDSIDELSTNYNQFADTSLAVQWVAGDTLSLATYNGVGTIDVDFTGGLGTVKGASGINSSTFILYTDATEYASGGITLQDTAIGSGMGLVPATPEPSSLMLLGTGLIGGAGMLMRRRRLTA